jgi:hypothetical protein
MIPSDAKVKQMEISAVITRADGTVENLGTIQYWHQNPLKRLLWRIKKWLHY